MSNEESNNIINNLLEQIKRMYLHIAILEVRKMEYKNLKVENNEETTI